MSNWLGNWGLIYTHDPNGFMSIYIDPRVPDLITEQAAAPPAPPPNRRNTTTTAPPARGRIVLLPGEIPCGCNNCRMA